MRARWMLACALLAACATGESGAMMEPPDATVDTGDDVAAMLDVSVDTATARDVFDSGADGAVALDANDAATDAFEVFDVRDEVRDVASDAGAQVDAGPMGDSLPSGAVMFFTAGACPEGWAAYMPADGRTVVPAAAAGGAVRGVALRNGEDPVHTHRVMGSFGFPEVRYVGANGGGNNGLGPSGSVSFAVDSAPASANVPYVQLMVCRKVAEARSYARPLPSGMLTFFAGERCPAGFSQAPGTTGRVLVGTPEGGTQGATWGGLPLHTVEAARHTHTTMVSTTTRSHGIALLSGCCGGGYAGNGTYNATLTSGEAEPAFPTITLLQCVKD